MTRFAPLSAADRAKRRSRSRLLFVATVTVVTLLVSAWGVRALHGLSFVVRAAGLQGIWRQVADVEAVSYGERPLRLPVRGGVVDARVYAPLRRSRQAVLLVSGLHAAGIDEPRLVAFARELAGSGLTVVTPAIPELSRFEITSVITDRIEQSALGLAEDPELAPTGRVGIMGISFGGGLSIVAAGRPALQDRVLYVFSFGGHDDLPRVLRYLCTGGAPAPFEEQSPRRVGVAMPELPHDYGVAVILLNIADHVVPPEQVEPLRDGVRRFLVASYLDREDKAAAEREFAALRAVARELRPPAATLLEAVNDRDVPRLGRLLLPYVESHAGAPALSPSRSPTPHAPIFLLHGRHDALIPAAESEHMARRLRGRAPLRLLLTDLVSHSEADQPAHPPDVLRLAGFWGDMLAR